MKIDVEGVEDRVLTGAVELMMRDKPIIFCEILPNAHAWAVIPTILERTNYKRAALYPHALIVQEGAAPELIAHNHILFPRSLELAVREIARSADVPYVEP